MQIYNLEIVLETIVLEISYNVITSKTKNKPFYTVNVCVYVVLGWYMPKVICKLINYL